LVGYGWGMIQGPLGKAKAPFPALPAFRYSAKAQVQRVRLGRLVSEAECDPSRDTETDTDTDTNTRTDVGCRRQWGEGVNGWGAAVDLLCCC
jgi:hypothetical protein